MENTDKKDSLLARMSNKSWMFVEQLFESFKFKKDDLWYHKTLKILLRIFSILVLIALSPLIIVTIFMIIALAS